MLSQSSLNSPSQDPNYNPPYVNDIYRPQRSGWNSVGHFIDKYSDHLAKATIRRLDSQLQFASCVTDHVGLRKRHLALQTLENSRTQDDLRVRFVNYYTASPGRPKKIKTVAPGEEDSSHMTAEATESLEPPRSGLTTASGSPRISIESVDDMPLSQVPPQVMQSLSLSKERSENDTEQSRPDSGADSTNLPLAKTSFQNSDVMKGMSSDSLVHSDRAETRRNEAELRPHSESLEERLGLGPLPSRPQEPLPFSPASFSDNETCKLMENEHSRQVKAFERELKAYERTIKERQKFIEKRTAAEQKAAEKKLSTDEKKKAKAEKELIKQEAKAQAKAESAAARTEAKEKARISREAQKQEDGDRRYSTGKFLHSVLDSLNSLRGSRRRSRRSR